MGFYMVKVEKYFINVYVVLSTSAFQFYED